MKNAFLKLPALLIFGMTTTGMLNADCLPTAPSGYTVPFSMATQRNFASGDPYASYTTGSMTISQSNSWFFSSTTYSSTNNPQLFSDRTAAIDCSGFACAQPFDINQADQLGVSITRSSSLFIEPGGNNTTITVTLTLQSWGNGTLSFPATCDATSGILYGTLGGNTHLAITLGTPVAPVVVN